MYRYGAECTSSSAIKCKQHTITLHHFQQENIESYQRQTNIIIAARHQYRIITNTRHHHQTANTEQIQITGTRMYAYHHRECIEPNVKYSIREALQEFSRGMKAEEAEYGDTAIYRHPTGLHNK
jgi:hypothetical protein